MGKTSEISRPSHFTSLYCMYYKCMNNVLDLIMYALNWLIATKCVSSIVVMNSMEAMKHLTHTRRILSFTYTVHIHTCTHLHILKHIHSTT